MIDEALPEINDCYVYADVCPDHGFNYVSMPRNDCDVTPYTAKCPLRTCGCGRVKQTIEAE
jgi:hypothetical protein